MDDGLILVDNLLRVAVFGLELFLTYCLVAWMRSSRRGRKEPWSFLIRIMAYGALTALIAAAIEVKYSFNLNELQYTAPELVANYGNWLELINNISASLIEELAKYVVAVFTVINSKHFHKMSDAIVYLILIGLGFSLIEDAIFLVHPETMAPYRLLSFYVHSGTSAIIGYAMGQFKLGIAGYWQIVIALCAAVLLHFGYNLAVNLDNPLYSFYLTCAITLFISLQIFVLFRKATLEEYHLERKTSKKEPHRLLNLKSKEKHRWHPRWFQGY